MKDVIVDQPLLLAPSASRIKYEPLGVVFVFGSWNYPYVVTLKPLL
jgi:acyl-CoA reductase-like NAD-dependent aldehyde dehydrogenase